MDRVYVETTVISYLTARASRDIVNRRGGTCMIRDPIVEEVYQVRERLLNECGGDLSKLIERQKAMAVPTGMKTATANQVRAAVTKPEAAAVELSSS